jgi:hypothetical protein
MIGAVVRTDLTTGQGASENQNILNGCCVLSYLGLIKTGSSAWIHQTFPNLRNFAWQQGYGAFSVGISQVEETVHYIEQQFEHHRTRTFQEEYLGLPQETRPTFRRKYLWD